MLIQPRADLYDRVIKRINREEKLMILKRRLILEFAGLMLSFFVFIPLVLRLISDIARSGLARFLALLISDFGIVAANFSDYILTILESTPAVSLVLALAAMLAVIFYTAKLEDIYADFKKLTITI